MYSESHIIGSVIFGAVAAYMALFLAHVARLTASAVGTRSGHVAELVAVVAADGERRRRGSRVGRRFRAVAGDVTEALARVALLRRVGLGAVPGDVADVVALVAAVLLLATVAGEMAETVALVAFLAAALTAALRAVRVRAFAGEVAGALAAEALLRRLHDDDDDGEYEKRT